MALASGSSGAVQLETNMSAGIQCPVCGETQIEPVLENVTVTATYDEFAGPIGALTVLRCQVYGHIFFVRQADLQIAAA